MVEGQTEETKLEDERLGGQEKIWEEEGARGRRGTSPSRDMVSHVTILSEAKRQCQ